MGDLSAIQKDIRKTIQEFESLKNINSHISEIDAQLSDAYKKIKHLDFQLDKELKDIDELQKIGVKSLFYKTLGSKEEQLEKERQEYLELSLKYKEYKKEVELMEYERDLLSAKVKGLSSLENKLAELKKARKSEILTTGNPGLRNEMTGVLHKMDTNIKLRTELEEALTEGEKTLKVLAMIINFLGKAEDWGRWDMYGDNRRAKYMKQQSIEQAVRFLPNAQHQLNLFVRELKDLGDDEIIIKLDAIHFNKFRDFFFDNLISDWIIQQRIRNTLNSIEGTHSHVQRIILSLKQEFRVIEQNLISLNKRKEQLILS